MPEMRLKQVPELQIPDIFGGDNYYYAGMHHNNVRTSEKAGVSQSLVIFWAVIASAIHCCWVSVGGSWL